MSHPASSAPAERPSVVPVHRRRPCKLKLAVGAAIVAAAPAVFVTVSWAQGASCG